MALHPPAKLAHKLLSKVSCTLFYGSSRLASSNTAPSPALPAKDRCWARRQRAEEDCSGGEPGPGRAQLLRAVFMGTVLQQAAHPLR